jgi:hypothetical protein
MIKGTVEQQESAATSQLASDRKALPVGGPCFKLINGPDVLALISELNAISWPAQVAN